MPAGHRSIRAKRLRCEPLEDRLAPAVLSIRASAVDTEISVAKPTTPLGSAAVLHVAGNVGGPTAQSLLRFDSLFGRGPDQIPAGSTIQSASLSFWVGHGASNSPVIGLHRMLEPWDPATATWKSFDTDNRGGVQTNGIEAAVSADGSVSNVGNAGYRTIGGLAGAVQAWAAGANYGWVLSTGTASAKWVMDSSESTSTAHRPVLTIQFDAPGEESKPSYSALNGAPPSPTSLSWFTWETALENARLGRIPSVRTSTFYFAADGNDATGTGEANSPWKSLAKAQAMLDASSGDVRLRFRRGDVWREATVLRLDKPDVTVDSFGDAALPAPLLSRFTRQFSTGWTQVAGSSAWRRAEPVAVGWLRPAADPLGTLYYRAKSAAEVNGRANSWYYDRAAGQLYVNPGATDPNMLPGGWDACPDDGLGWVVTGDRVRLQDVQIHGSGLASSGIGAGLMVSPGRYGEFAGISVAIAFAGSKGIAVSGTDTAITLLTCSAGLLVNRGGTGVPGSGDVTPFDIDGGSGGSELILRDNIVSGGALPSADWAALPGQRHGRYGVFEYTQGPSLPPALSIALRTQYPDRPWQVGGGTLVWGPTVNSAADARAYIVGESPVDGIDSQPGLGSADRVYVNNTYTHLTTGRLTGSPTAIYAENVYGSWAYNTTVRADASQLSVSADSLSWFGGKSTLDMQLENSRFDVTGVTVRPFEFVPAEAELGPNFAIRNSMLTVTGSTAADLGGALSAGRLDHNAYAFPATLPGLNAVDPAPVVLASPLDAAQVPASDDALFGAGQINGLEFDAGGLPRPSSRMDIGPVVGMAADASNRNKAYNQLAGVGTPPSPDDPAWFEWEERLQNARLANVPIERGTTYYFAQSGNDYTGDGSLAQPFQSIAWANGLVSNNSAAANLGGSALVAPDLLQFQPNGKDFSIAMWTGFINTGNSKIAARIGSWSLGFVDETHIGLTVIGAGTGISTTVQWPAEFGAGWHLVVAGFDSSAGRAYVSVDGGPAQFAQVPEGIASGLGSLRLFTTSATNYAQGVLDDVAYWSSGPGLGGALTDAQIADLYRGGVGRRYEELPAAMRPTLVSWWNLDEYYNATLYADKKGLANLSPLGTISVFNDVRAVPGGTRLRFRGGDLWRDDASITITAPFVTIDSYGEGKAQFSRFTQTFAPTWTHIGPNLWKQNLAADIGWLRPAADPLGTILKAELTSPKVMAYPGSFYYDSSGVDPNSLGLPTLYLNPGVDVDPNLVPGGYESAKFGDGWSVFSDNVRLQNLRVDGAGISPLLAPSSGYGLYIQQQGLVRGEFVGVGLEFYFTGYHAYGHISEGGGIATLVDCKGGLCTNRAGTGAPGSGDVIPFVSYAPNGGQEFLMVDCEVSFGALPSWDWDAQPGQVHGSSGVYQHDANGLHSPLFSIALRTRYPDNPWQVYGGTIVYGPSAATLADVRGYVVGERARPGVSGQFAYSGSNVAYINCSYSLPVYSNYVAPALFKAPDFLMDGWAINCSIDVDLSLWQGSGSGFSIVAASAGAVNTRFLNCRFDVTNLNEEEFHFLDSATSFAGPRFRVENSIISVSGTQPMSMGPVLPTSLRNNAYYFSTGAPANLRAQDPGAVILPESPDNAPPIATSPLFAAGTIGASRFDIDGLPRGSGRTDIGPLAGVPLPVPSTVYLGAGRALMPLTPGQSLTARAPIDRIVAYFDREVDVSALTAILVAERGIRFAAATVEYTPGQNFAVWRLTTPFAAGRARLAIDSTWVGDFRFDSGFIR